MRIWVYRRALCLVRFISLGDFNLSPGKTMIEFDAGSLAGYNWPSTSFFNSQTLIAGQESIPVY